jgi:hypothetical protein
MLSTLFEMSRQLLFLVLQSETALLEASFFLGRGRLLGGNRGRLDAQGIPLVFQDGRIGYGNLRWGR